MNHEAVQVTLRGVFERIRSLSDDDLRHQIMSRVEGKIAQTLRDSGYFRALEEEATEFDNAGSAALLIAYIRSEMPESLSKSKVSCDYGGTSSPTTWLQPSTDPANLEFILDATGDLLWLTTTAA